MICISYSRPITSYYLCRLSSTHSAQSSVVSEQARRSTASEVEPDQLLVQEVEEFVEKLMEWYEY